MHVALVGMVLAGVLALSAVAKLRDRSSTRSATRLLRLPRLLQAPWVAVALPVGELLLAALLLATPAPLVVVPAVAALVLFVVYLAVIARALRFDPRPDCSCFGRIGDQRVSAKTLVRNLLLVALAGWFVVDTWPAGTSVPGALSGFGSDDVGWLLAAMLAGAVTVLVLLPAPGSSAPRLTPGPVPTVEPEGPLDYLRTPFPPATLLTHDGQPRSLADLTREAAVLLIGMDCTCGSVAEVAQRLPEWRSRLAPVRLVVFTPAEPTPLRRAFDLPPDDLLLDHQYHLWNQWNLVRGMPAAVLLGADGLLAGGPVTGPALVTDFVTAVIEQLDEAAADQPQASDSTQA
ncbi:MauE/DoxX family redox-associated membrane protein [Aestuariimicrobium soli]|uniref:MauE/DoxX family redox-associated membrane protein n=1 Tax=Aestuariimicrobium soli TaxID=2035834 RepID=UPI003EB9CFD1